jgi:hypothetical protein
MIALASVDTAHSQPGSKLQVEITIEAVRQKVTATVVKLPFFNPARKTATPVLKTERMHGACAYTSACVSFHQGEE